MSEVRRGYKQTEVGVIPEDWATQSLLGHVAILHGFGFQSQYFTEMGTLRLTTPGHFYEDGGFRELGEKQKYYDGPLPHGYLLEKGDLIVAMTEQADGLLGSAAFVPVSGTYLHNQRLGRVKVLSPNLSKEFLYRLFNSRSYRAGIRETAAGTKVKHTSPAKLLEITVPIPPTRPEQEAIAEALSDADALIESLEQLLTKKRQIKQGAMQELLTGKKRLPGFQSKPGYKQTEVGPLPEDWEVQPLGKQLVEPPSYGINAPAVPFDSRLPTYLRITDITDDGRFVESTKVSVAHPSSTDYLLQPGDLVLARTGASVGKSYLYAPTDGRLVFAGFLIRVTPNSAMLTPAFLSFLLQTRVYWNWVKMNSMRSGQPGINGQEYARLPIPIPAQLAEQTAIAAVLSDMDAAIAALETKLTKARQLKLGMMQELLTGRIRLV
jgi:type I restriction enzyme S subunit